MAHIKDVTIGNNTYLLEPTVYAVTAGNSSSITAAITNFSLDTGVVVTLKMTNPNVANTKLNVNNTGAIFLKYNNENIPANKLKENKFYSFVYDGQFWQLIGELDTDTTYENLGASNGSTDVSLVTTGEKYTWNNKSPKIELIDLTTLDTGGA